MNTTSTSARAFLQRGLSSGPAFFSAGGEWVAVGSRRLLAFVTGFLLLASAVRGDLVVLQPGGGGAPNAGSAQVWRFDTASGTALSTFSQENEGFTGMSVTADNDVYVTTNILGGYTLYRFNRLGSYRGAATGGNQGDFNSVIRGSDGNLYCLGRQGSFNFSSLPPAHILRLDQPSPTIFVANGTGGMTNPTSMTRGPDGNFYVIEADIGIMRFNGTTGASMGVVVPLGRGGLANPRRAIFGPDGRLYISTGANNSVLRYDGSTGVFIDAFVAAGAGGLSEAVGLAFGPDGNLYVSSRSSHQVLRYSGSTGAFMNVFVSRTDLRYPTDLAFTAGSSTDATWFDDAAPAGAAIAAAGWSWVASPAALSGTAVLQSPGGGNPPSYAFNFASQPLPVATGDTLFIHLKVGSTPPGEIMLSWCDGANWEHRAYWNGNIINEGQNGTVSRRYMGGVPRPTTSDGWVRLEVPAALVGLEGTTLQGMAITLVGGSAAQFDLAGKGVAGPTPPPGPDTTPPTVQIISPTDGATVSGQLSISARGTDNTGGSVRLNYSLDGSTAGYASYWDTTRVANGSHIIRVIGTDVAGNSAQASVTVTVNNAPAPVIPWWVDDDMPAGAWGAGTGGDRWNWVSTSPAPFSGTRAHQSALAAGLHEHYFAQAATPLALGDNDLIVAHVYLDPANPPQELMLSFFDGTSWEHRAYWGFDRIGYGTSNTDSRRYVGGVPAAGSWVRLEVPASRVGLAGRSIVGIGFAAFDGRVTWDAIGKATSAVDVTRPVMSITSPTNGATVAGTVNIAVNATDNERVQQVTVYVDGAHALYTFNPPYAFSWDTTYVANGTHTLRVVVVDGRNNSAEQSISVTVNNDPGTTDLAPKLRFTAPFATTFDDRGQVVTSPGLYGTVQVSTEAVDDHGIAWVEFELPGQGATARLTAPPYSVAWNTKTVASGQVAILARVADTRGQQIYKQLYVNVDHTLPGDTTAPTIAITAPTAGATLVGDVAVTVNAADNDAVGSVRYYLNGNPMFANLDAGYGFTWTTRNVANGTHTLQAVAYDRVGLTATTSVTVTIDNPPQDFANPTVAMTAPTNDSIVSGAVAVTAVASDNLGVASVQFYLDGAPIHTSDTTVPHGITWDSRTVADGSHVLSAIATDTSGRTSTRSVTTVTVNNRGTPPQTPTGPDVIWFDDNLPSGASAGGSGGDAWTWVTSNPAPTSGARAHQSNIAAGLHEHYFDWAYAGAFAVSATDTLFAWVYLDPANAPREIMLNWRDEGGWEHRAYWGANLIDYGIDGTASRRRIGDLPAPGVWTKLTIPASSVGLGASSLLGMSFSVFDGRATWDAAGKRGAGSDTNSPSVAITAPAAGTTVSGSVNVTATAGDNVGVTSVKFYADSHLIGEATTAPFLITWNTSALANAYYTLTAVARDAAGNQATSAQAGVSVNNAGTADTTPPSVYINSLSSGATVVGTSVSLAAGAYDNVGIASVQFRLDGVNLGAAITSPPFSMSWNSTTVANGTHSLTAVAKDPSGNQATASAVMFTVNNPTTPPADTTAPTVAITGPANNSPVTGNAISITANAADNIGVASVVFRVDGSDIATDTTAPYSVTWNSTTVANGSHSLTAIARDAAGNSTTSAAVIVSVNNSSSSGAVIWMDSAVPAGAMTGSFGGDAWTWVTSNPTPFAGTRVHQSAIVAGMHDHYFVGASSPFQIFTGDTIFAYVYLDPANVPSEIMLSFNDGTWEQRAYWGANVITYGQDGTNSRRLIGPIPVAGQWVRLEVPARLVGLEGRMINGVSFTLVGGRATWDIVGKVSP